MSVPLLAIPYVYLTYFEILHIPIRNVIFFVYLLAGALVYVAVVAIARIDRTCLLPHSWRVRPLACWRCWRRSASIGAMRGFLAPLIAAYALTLLFDHRQRRCRADSVRAVHAWLLRRCGAVRAMAGPSADAANGGRQRPVDGRTAGSASRGAGASVRVDERRTRRQTRVTR